MFVNSQLQKSSIRKLSKHETFKADDKLLDGAPELIHPHYYFFVSARGETPRHVRFLTDALPGTSIPLVGNEAYIEKCVLQIKESVGQFFVPLYGQYG